MLCKKGFPGLIDLNMSSQSNFDVKIVELVDFENESDETSESETLHQYFGIWDRECLCMH
jgi:hypothetical protein